MKIKHTLIYNYTEIAIDEDDGVDYGVKTVNQANDIFKEALQLSFYSEDNLNIASEEIE